MIEQPMVVGEDEVLRAIELDPAPRGETSILLTVLRGRGLRIKEYPGETPARTIRKHFDIAVFRRALKALEERGAVERLTGAEWRERGIQFYDQRPTGKYWAVPSKTQPPAKASGPRVAPTPRQQIHKAFCATQYECKYEGARDRSLWCTLLDELLDHNDEMLLHAKARELDARLEKMESSQRIAHARGVVWARREIDPFEEVEHGGVTDCLSPKAMDGYKNCPACEKGTKHCHRKSDDSIVKMPNQEAHDAQ